jgi:RNA polymerase subunit RPABC4/transcription elongation factor Spt4
VTGESDFRRLARVCPHCGGREPTLGDVCPLCGRPYEQRAWHELRVIDVDDDLVGLRGGFIVVPLVELLNLLVAAAWALLTLPVRLAAAAWRRRTGV